MILLEDTRQQAKKHEIKHRYFDANGIKVERSKLYVGDYTLPTNQSVCVDSKKDIAELIGDICGKQHDRFRAELVRAQESGIKLYILVENKGGEIGHTGVFNKTITDLSQLHSWKNPRLFIRYKGKQKYPQATRGITLQKACYTMQKKYGVTFLFCHPDDSGKIIVELLTGEQ